VSAGSCKCGARTYSEHRKKVESRAYTWHLYTGHYWAPRDDAEWNRDDRTVNDEGNEL